MKITVGRDKIEGFTLIELLIVLVIISVIASFAALSIHFNENKRLESISNQLVNLFMLAEQEAILRSTPLGFGLTKTEFQFYEYQNTLKPWKIITTTTLGKHPIPKDISIQLKQNEDKEVKIPQIIISAGGETTAFTILIGKKDKRAAYAIVGEGNGSVKSKRINE